jgi:hypothetical protein
MTQENGDRRPGAAKRSGMDLEFLARVRRASMVVGAVVAAPVALYWGWQMGAAWLSGVAWSLVNLFFIGEVIKHVITAGDRDLPRILVAVAVKFPVLYALGFLLLWIEWLPVIGLVAGFSWPFFVMVLKAIGRAYLRLDERGNDEGRPSRA